MAEELEFAEEFEALEAGFAAADDVDEPSAEVLAELAAVVGAEASVAEALFGAGDPADAMVVGVV